MRDMLTNSLSILVWIATGFFVVNTCVFGAVLIHLLKDSGLQGAVISGFLSIFFGLTMSFVFAGICFQIMDIRQFNKHIALMLKRQQQR